MRSQPLIVAAALYALAPGVRADKTGGSTTPGWSTHAKSIVTETVGQLEAARTGGGSRWKPADVFPELHKINIHRGPSPFYRVRTIDVSSVLGRLKLGGRPADKLSREDWAANNFGLANEMSKGLGSEIRASLAQEGLAVTDISWPWENSGKLRVKVRDATEPPIPNFWGVDRSGKPLSAPGR
jgi:hypothetical protein